MDFNTNTKTAMVLAAGFGTRLRPLTDSLPKALVEVNGRPMVRNVLDLLSAEGYNRFVVNIHHFAPMMREYFRKNGNFGLDVNLSEEVPYLLDTGGGILHARALLESCENFLVHNVDIFSDLDFRTFEARSESREGISSLLVSRRQSRSGRYLLFDSDLRLCGWMDERSGEVRSPYNALDPSRCNKLAFNGIHLVSRSIFEAFEKAGLKDGDSFSIADFYVRNCDRYPVWGICLDPVNVIDEGRIEALPKAAQLVERVRYKRGI